MFAYLCRVCFQALLFVCVCLQVDIHIHMYNSTRAREQRENMEKVVEKEDYVGLVIVNLQMLFLSDPAVS